MTKIQSFEQQLAVHQGQKTPFISRELHRKKLKELLQSKQS